MPDIYNIYIYKFIYIYARIIVLKEFELRREQLFDIAERFGAIFFFCLFSFLFLLSFIFSFGGVARFLLYGFHTKARL